MRKTLDENGVEDDIPEFDQVTLAPTHVATSILCPNPAARLTWTLHRKLGS